MGEWVSFDTSIHVLSSKRSKRITVIQHLIIRYENSEAYQEHGQDTSTKYVSYLWTLILCLIIILTTIGLRKSLDHVARVILNQS